MLRSEELYRHALQYIPGGVNSPVRAFGSVGGIPRFIKSASGSRLWDVDGQEYIDLIGSWGPMILGHTHPQVVAAVTQAAQHGLSFGAPTERESLLANAVLSRYPQCEQIRLVNSGTEATMSALRLARGATGRSKIIKFAGNYHGHADSLLVAAGSGAMTTGVPSSAGVPADIAKHTLVAEYNDLGSVAQHFHSYPDDIAAVIFEPVVGNMGVVIPKPDFLTGLQQLTKNNGALLIADEVMTGFRLARGGAVERFSLEPDIVCWGKILGGGLPVGAYGANATLMAHISPLGKVYQAGTLSGNPLAMAAGLATFEVIDATPDLYSILEARGAQLEAGLTEAVQAAGIPAVINRVGSMLTLFFSSQPVENYSDALQCNTELFKQFFHGMLDRGVYWPPSAFEAAFLSFAHSEEDIAAVISIAKQVLATLNTPH